MRGEGPATCSEEIGTLGATTGIVRSLLGGAGWAGRSESVHAPGDGSTGLSGVLGHACWPSGMEATPGAGWAGVESPQAAAAPEDGHCCAPAGRLSWALSAAADTLQGSIATSFELHNWADPEWVRSE
ncbi:MAG TPA: hypothetical protein VET26_01040 [Candidatus Sulfotelmatobacter sp.]|nr:hypothetical protein [Candidatus Sulfotelmatobacter sp.]